MNIDGEDNKNKEGDKEPIVGSTDIIPSIKTGYEWLQEMILVRNEEASYTGIYNPITERVMFIMQALNSIGVQYQLDVFKRHSDGFLYETAARLVNITAEFGNETQPAVVFVAHHDIANRDSENCQDNSASVCNLLHMCGILKHKTDLKERVIILFTDCEESGGKGAIRFARQANKDYYGTIKHAINLELTGLGSEMWMDTNNYTSHNSPLKKIMMDKIPNIYGVGTPFSDAIPLRRVAHKFESICVGILPLKEIESEKETWWLCHSENDTIDKCDAEDMEHLVIKLERFLV